ncbi:hypothetical protein T440DRAFT_540611 [Plenodomus tracheiphilus IPT5]|uniref:Extracellular membrane protein CFEM domain-containing protein n=1 Tax=Plenodomus tracheiphilus IPT5 TaxID=1408161 RepID=A0A6A7AU57_9PLEO|nr:hypothetical protein T440DRAFT_540611 [Plenodomus tracheiphilus IPT5]
MKYSAVLLFAIGAFAIPQDATVTSAPAAAAIPSGLSAPVSCALACEAGDVTCQAACLGNARPNASQAIATNECAAKCDQGDGSTAASQAFARCVDACINSLFPSSQTANIPGAAGGAASSAASAAASATRSALSTASAGASAASGSGSGASPQSTGAADMNSARIAGAGLAGLFAIFAL